MEDRPVLIMFLAAWAVYLPLILAATQQLRLSLTIAALSQAAPTTIAVVMAYIFLIRQGATVAQYVAGSQTGMDLWSLWFELWPLLLLAAVVSSLGHLGAIIVAAPERSARKYLVITVPGMAMSVFGFLAAAANFPDA